MNRKIILTLLGFLAIGIAAGCIWQSTSSKKQQTEVCTRETFAMDTVMQFTAYGKNSEAAVTAAIEEVNRLDGLLSTGSPSSEVSGINKNGMGSVSEDTESLIKAASDIYDTTNGLFDFTIYPLMQLWGFTNKEYHVPSEDELKEVLPYVDAGIVCLDGDTLILGENQQIDFGGIAKGYTSARVIGIFKEYGITSGIVSLGGNVQTLNGKPDGSDWRIGIQDPNSTRGEYMGVVSVNNEAVVTSGGYERYFEQNGQTYIHILDPRTGYPAESDLLSVTIVSPDGMLADGLSTSLYIMGLEEAISYWEKYGKEFEIVLITNDRDLYISEGLEKRFEANGKIHVIRATS